MPHKTVGDVLALRHIDQLRLLTPQDFNGRDLAADEYDHIFEVCGALWRYDYSGDPTRPHVRLTSAGHPNTEERCSDGYINLSHVFCYPNLCRLLGTMLVRQLVSLIGEEVKRKPYPGWVVSSDHTAMSIGFMVALLLNAKFEATEKAQDTGQRWSRHIIEERKESVLQVEDIVTSRKTLTQVRQALRDYHKPGNVAFSPCVLTVVNRGDLATFESSVIIALRHYPTIQVWPQQDCLLCKAGSERLYPKDAANWALLTGKS